MGIICTTDRETWTVLIMKKLSMPGTYPKGRLQPDDPEGQ